MKRDPQKQRWIVSDSLRNAFMIVFMLLLLLASTKGSAQTYAVLWQFTSNAGSAPWGKLVSSGQTLYGVARYSDNHGAVFKINTGGSNYTVLHEFAGYPDGSDPMGALVLSGSTLYGTTGFGGSSTDPGTVFKINIDGSDFVTLKDFASGGGRWPYGNLVLSGTALYGTTCAGGSAGDGTVFKVNTDGSDFSVLHNFTGYPGDGRWPDGALSLSGTTLYGATPVGGSYGSTINPEGCGTLFQIQIDGSGYTILKQFTGSEGWGPYGGLVLSGTTLYGTTGGGYQNGKFGGATVFKINTDGSGYRVLHNFSGPPEDGATPYGGLVLSGTRLFGTTTRGGRYGYSPASYDYGSGTIFTVNTDGSGYKVVKEFTGDDGCWPYAGLLLEAGTLYGTTISGGISNRGVVFALRCAPLIQGRPQNQTAEAGGAVNLSVRAGGVPPLTYQWFFNASAVTDCTTNRVFGLSGVQTSNAGAYTVVVSNVFGAVTSEPVSLNVIPPVPHWPVAGVKVTGQSGSLLSVDYADTLEPPPVWNTLGSVRLDSMPQYYFDPTTPLPAQRFYRVWQAGTPTVVPALDLNIISAITLTGNIGDRLRLDYINQFGAIDAWITLDTVTLTNTPQLYFDTSAWRQPQRLYRIVAVP